MGRRSGVETRLGFRRFVVRSVVGKRGAGRGRGARLEIGMREGRVGARTSAGQRPLNAVLKGNGRKPFLREASLQERYARGHVSESVDPSGDFLANEDLGKGRGKMVAVFVHEVIAVASVLLAELRHNALYFVFREICVAQVQRLPAIESHRTNFKRFSANWQGKKLQQFFCNAENAEKKIPYFNSVNIIIPYFNSVIINFVLQFENDQARLKRYK